MSEMELPLPPFILCVPKARGVPPNPLNPSPSYCPALRDWYSVQLLLVCYSSVRSAEHLLSNGHNADSREELRVHVVCVKGEKS